MNTQHKHTPGPWNAHKYPDVKTWSVASDKSIASKIECEANATLIAAAPELLEALEALVLADTAICENTGTKSDQAMNRIAALDKANSAIARARGES